MPNTFAPSRETKTKPDSDDGYTHAVARVRHAINQRTQADLEAKLFADLELGEDA